MKIWTNDSNPDWPHIRAQVEQTLDWFMTWDAADQSLGYSPMEDAELIIALGSALTALAEHNGITTHIYGVETRQLDAKLKPPTTERN